MAIMDYEGGAQQFDPAMSPEEVIWLAEVVSGRARAIEWSETIRDPESGQVIRTGDYPDVAMSYVSEPGEGQPHTSAVFWHHRTSGGLLSPRPVAIEDAVRRFTANSPVDLHELAG